MMAWFSIIEIKYGHFRVLYLFLVVWKLILKSFILVISLVKWTGLFITSTFVQLSNFLLGSLVEDLGLRIRTEFQHVTHAFTTRMEKRRIPEMDSAPIYSAHESQFSLLDTTLKFLFQPLNITLQWPRTRMC